MIKKLLMSASLTSTLFLTMAVPSANAAGLWQLYSQTGSGFNTVCHYKRPILNSSGQQTGQYEYYQLTTNPLLKGCASLFDRLPR